MANLLKNLWSGVGRRVARASLAVLGPETKERLIGAVGVPSVAATLRSLKAKGVSPKAAVDVGGFQGGWSREFRKVFPQARLLIVEPQPRYAERLAQVCRELGGGASFAPRLVGPEVRAAMPFTILEDGAGGAGSSVLPENSNVPRHVEMLPMTTLEQLVEEFRFPKPDFLKLDVQGYELEVLKGAGALLPGADFVQLEISAWQYNQGSPLFHEVIAWMEKAGFVTHDLCEIHRLPDATLSQLDILFVRKDSGYIRNTKTIFSEWSPDADKTS